MDGGQGWLPGWSNCKGPTRATVCSHSRTGHGRLHTWNFSAFPRKANPAKTVGSLTASRTQQNLARCLINSRCNAASSTASGARLLLRHAFRHDRWRLRVLAALFEPGGHRIQRVLAAAQHARHTLFPAIEQILGFEDDPPALPSQAPIAIVGRIQQPSPRLFSRLRSKQQRQSQPDANAQQKTRCPAAYSVGMGVAVRLGIIISGVFFTTHDALSNRKLLRA